MHKVLIIGLGLCFAASLGAQGTPDARKKSPESPPHDIKSLIAEILRIHPLLRSRQIEAQAADLDAQAVARQKWGSVSLTTETNGAQAHTGSYASRMLRLDQTVWDNGLARSREDEAQVRLDQAQLQIDEQVQDLSLQASQAWQALNAARGKIDAARNALERLRGYMQQMSRRVQSQASPQIDLELTQARILQTEAELTAAQGSYRLALQKLENLSGLQGLTGRMPVTQSLVSAAQQKRMAAQLAQETDWNATVTQHPTYLRTKYEIQALEHKLSAKKAEQWPQVYLRMDKPLAQNELAGISSMSPSYYAGIRYNTGAGLVGHAEAQAMAARLGESEQRVHAVRQELQQQLSADKEEFTNNHARLPGLTRSVSSSETVLASYLRQFHAGKKNWQDLLNVQRELLQNQYALSDAHASLLGAVLRLQIRTSQPIQTD